MTFANFEQIFRKYSFNPAAGDVYKQSIDKRFSTLTNTGVQTNLIFLVQNVDNECPEKVRKFQIASFFGLAIRREKPEEGL